LKRFASEYQPAPDEPTVSEPLAERSVRVARRFSPKGASGPSKSAKLKPVMESASDTSPSRNSPPPLPGEQKRRKLASTVVPGPRPEASTVACGIPLASLPYRHSAAAPVPAAPSTHPLPCPT